MFLSQIKVYSIVHNEFGHQQTVFFPRGSQRMPTCLVELVAFKNSHICSRFPFSMHCTHLNRVGTAPVNMFAITVIDKLLYLFSLVADHLKSTVSSSLFLRKLGPFLIPDSDQYGYLTLSSTKLEIREQVTKLFMQSINKSKLLRGAIVLFHLFSAQTSDL